MNKTRPIIPYNDEDGGDEIMTIQEFKDSIECGALTDDDGHGEWATVTHVHTGTRVHPSDVFVLVPPEGVTHVCWYNK